MAQDDPFEAVPPQVRATVENFINRIVQEATTGAERALRDAGLVATVSYVRNGAASELIITSNLSKADHSRAEDILEAALQSVLFRVYDGQHTLH